MLATSPPCSVVPPFLLEGVLAEVLAGLLLLLLLLAGLLDEIFLAAAGGLLLLVATGLLLIDTVIESFLISGCDFCWGRNCGSFADDADDDDASSPTGTGIASGFVVTNLILLGRLSESSDADSLFLLVELLLLPSVVGVSARVRTATRVPSLMPLSPFSSLVLLMLALLMSLILLGRLSESALPGDLFLLVELPVVELLLVSVGGVREGVGTATSIYSSAPLSPLELWSSLALLERIPALGVALWDLFW
ncbi:hypothetical protein QBC32DRAFT_120653 [Pseudoneurospora amorphoporcata]|uniref:Uncharacterized protein n=1 Tax=Pseudoneurospora amorphoporcata TaxID=241081 RepID=A0AAN6NWF3_9PEZI|nr:hypothetical protein QBC32DRAFT_120653 [Pseudoneurospora amorphoporcata]